MPDILIIEENKKGDDIIIGDVHGNNEQLGEVLKILGEHDRLIIVGDLVDRGKDSLGVIDRIRHVNAEQEKKGLPPKILAIRGNHEEMFLRIAQAILDNPDRDPQMLLSKTDIKNGCGWIAGLTVEQLQRMSDFIKPLPYILRVNGDHPYNVVHADLPMAGAVLEEQVSKNNLSLTAEEKHHAIWARENKPRYPAIHTAGDYPSITYCGHNVGGGVRDSTKHFNLDVNSYRNGCTVAVKHKAKKFMLVVNNPKNALINLQSNSDITASGIMRQSQHVLDAIYLQTEAAAAPDIIPESREAEAAVQGSKQPLQPQIQQNIKKAITLFSQEIERLNKKYKNDLQTSYQGTIKNNRVLKLQESIAKLQEAKADKSFTHSNLLVLLNDVKNTMHATTKLSLFFSRSSTGQRIIGRLIKKIEPPKNQANAKPTTTLRAYKKK